MRIALKLAFDERAAVRLLNWLARENVALLKARPDIPLLYESGVIYRRERDETWSDAINTLASEVDAVTSAPDAHTAEFLGRYRVSPRAPMKPRRNRPFIPPNTDAPVPSRSR